MDVYYYPTSQISGAIDPWIIQNDCLNYHRDVAMGLTFEQTELRWLRNQQINCRFEPSGVTVVEAAREDNNYQVRFVSFVSRLAAPTVGCENRQGVVSALVANFGTSMAAPIMASAAPCGKCWKQNLLAHTYSFDAGKTCLLKGRLAR